MADVGFMRGLSRSLLYGQGISTSTISAPDSGIGWIIQAQNASSISKIWLRYSTSTGTPPTYKISIQGVSGAGVPDGIILASGTFTPPPGGAWSITGQWITLDSPYTPTLGQKLALTIEYDSGTIDGSNNSTFGRHVTSFYSNQVQFPYSVRMTSGAWAKATGNTNPIWAVYSADGVYGSPWISGYSSTSGAGTRKALAFTMPVDQASTYKIAGMMAACPRIGGAGASAKIAIWDALGNELTTESAYDTDCMANPTNEGTFDLLFETQPTLNAGTTYFIGIECLSSVIGLEGFNVTNPEDRAAYPMGLSRAYAEWNGASWSVIDTRLPILDLVFKDVTPPTDGGGGGAAVQRGRVFSS